MDRRRTRVAVIPTQHFAGHIIGALCLTLLTIFLSGCRPEPRKAVVGLWLLDHTVDLAKVESLTAPDGFPFPSELFRPGAKIRFDPDGSALMCPPIDSATPFYNAVGGYAWLTSDTIWFRIYHTEGEGNCYVHGFKFHAAVRKDVVLGRRLKLMSQASGLRIESEYSDISYLMRRVQSGIPRTQ